MEADALVDTLESAGLSPYEASAYVALLDIGAGSATEIADASDVPGPRIYDVLDSLSERGYVETYEQDTHKARAHSLTEVLEDLRTRADRFEDAADEIEEQWEQPTLESTKASIVKRFRTVIDRARLFIEDADNQIHLSVTPGDFERLRDALERAYERGVAIHVLIHTDLEGDPPPREEFAGVCTEARYRGLPTPFVALVDRQQACFAHHPDSFERYGVLVDDRTHTFVFHWYFMTCLWENARSIYTERTPEPPLEYVDIRQFVREMRLVLESDATVTVTVDGHEVESGEARSFTGTVAGANYDADPGAGNASPHVAGQVMLLVDVETETVSVGGWNAVVEDVEATHIVVEDIEHDGTVPSPATPQPDRDENH